MIKAILTGELTRDGVEKTTKAGKPYVWMNVRVPGDKVQFVTVLNFAPTYPIGAFKRGVQVQVEGSLKAEEWTGGDGQRRFGLNVMSSQVAVIGAMPTAKKVETVGA